VANAILDGTDCVMLSGESAMGKFPEEAVTMLANIATYTESQRPRMSLADRRELVRQPENMPGSERMASLVEHALDTVPCDIVLVPTRSGATARVISRSKPRVWIVSPCSDPAACQGLAFSYGVHAVDLPEEPADWREFAFQWTAEHGLNASRALLVAGPSARNPAANHRIELLLSSTR
jgi:pyruvate kinase